MEAELALIEPSRRESVKKKKKKKTKRLRHGTDAPAAVLDAAPRVGLQCGTLPAAKVLHSF